MKRLFSRLAKKSAPAEQAPVSGGSSGESSTFLTGDDRIDSANVRVLLHTMAELISQSDPAQLIRSIVDRAIKSVGAERGFLFREGDSGEMEIVVARDDQGRDLDGDIRYSTTAVRQVHEQGAKLCMRISESEQGSDLSASVVDLKLRAVLCVRLRFQEKILGVIYVDSRLTSREFTKKDLSFFDAMAVALSIAMENSRLIQEAIERERLARSIEIARQILVELLPDNPKGLPGFDLAGRCLPAESAAGDYYDFIPSTDGSLAVVVGDVTGHGIGPAMIMTGARSALRTLFEQHQLSEAEVAQRLNHRLEEDLADDMFMSMIVCRLHPDRRELAFCNAGQSSPLLLRKDGTVTTLSGKGPALGIDAGIQYSNGAPVQLAPGDILALFTDGIIELRSPDGEEFGMTRLQETIQELSGRTAQEILDQLYQRAARFMGGREQEDDVTMVILKANE